MYVSVVRVPWSVLVALHVSPGVPVRRSVRVVGVVRVVQLMQSIGLVATGGGTFPSSAAGGDQVEPPEEAGCSPGSTPVRPRSFPFLFTFFAPLSQWFGSPGDEHRHRSCAEKRPLAESVQSVFSLSCPGHDLLRTARRGSRRAPAGTRRGSSCA